VRPEFRKQGLGFNLMQAVARVGVEKNCGRFEWTALDWNEKALDFYDRLGAQKLDEWILLRMDAAELQRLGATAK
jgi:GNAT superfamily N-acetyltransferase